MKKSITLIAILAFLCVIMLYLIFANIGLKKSINDLSIQKEKEFNERVAEEKEKIAKDLDELHRADMVSYEAMSKKVEKMQDNVRKLQGQLDSKETGVADEKTN
ncbi:MAG: hypothetical protein ISS34_05135 [Candidatus Omnitrophica bacterium]|nr:hypothetical protein [Candidatus Omnitrophota bacterium]